MITKKVFPTYRTETGKFHMRGEEMKIVRSTGTKIEYRFMGILFYRKIFRNHLYYEDVECTDSIQTDF
jgi:hypothetical protein